MGEFVEPGREYLATDILIIGGGTAGCLAAVEAREQFPDLDVLIMEKANIERSGCLAAGMNAINAYLNPGESPESFTRYVRYDALGLCREDLVLSIAEGLNEAVRRVEGWGLPVLKDALGRYVPRGRWNIRINGERLKPILAAAVERSGARVLNRVAATNYLLAGDQVVGAVGVGVRDGRLYIVSARAVIVATGGAAGVYRPNSDGQAHHKMWYSPFNTGAGYAMGIRAGAEMTSFEMRFIALRTKGVICPTGTLALGFGAPQVNARGQRFMALRYSHVGGEGAPTAYRAYAPTLEVKEGRGPCYMDTRHLSPARVRDLKTAYLDMYPGIVLYWAANGIDPTREPIEIEGTEPYIVGGHCQAGYWITPARATTLPGLFAAGDVAGGAPYKFVSGCWVEGTLAARSAGCYAATRRRLAPQRGQVETEAARVYAPARRHAAGGQGVTPAQMEERLQKTMDQYAGGISTFYEMNEERLLVAERLLAALRDQVRHLMARDPHELVAAHEVVDRLDVAEVLVQHLLHRRETRWPAFQSRLDYPFLDDFNWLKFVNSRRNPVSGRVEIIERPYEQIVPGDRYLPR